MKDVMKDGLQKDWETSKWPFPKMRLKFLLSLDFRNTGDFHFNLNHKGPCLECFRWSYEMTVSMV